MIKQTEKQVKGLRTNNRLEYVKMKFTKFCKKFDIVPHIPCAGSPQYDGVAKWMNKTLLEKRFEYVCPH